MSKLTRYAYLDGIRGLAAVLVLTRHTGSFWGFSIYRSYLAVDLFFILSGFVIAHAYDRKLHENAISASDFIVIRLIRLYPVFFLSFCLCAISLITKTLLKHDIESSIFVDAIGVLALTALILPSRIPGDASLFPTNGPYWSLFFELIANFMYAVARPVLTTAALIAVVALLGVLVALAAGVNGNLDIGSNWGAVSVVSGLCRALFGVSYGLLLQRWTNKVSHPTSRYLPWLAVSVVVFVLTTPTFGALDPVFDVFVVAVAFPVCVVLASHAHASRADSFLVALGAASYPIYVLHQPIGHAISRVAHGLEAAVAPYGGILLVAALIPATVWLERIYDIPIRSWLSRKAFGSR